MQLKSSIIFSVCIAALVALPSCSKVKKLVGKGEKSSTTGWRYNDPDNGGFEYRSGYQQPVGPGLVFVQGGTFTMGRTEQDVMFDWNNVPRRVTVPSFYIDETEVRNIDYLEYLHWIKRVYVDYPEVYQKALPDTLVWRSELAYNEPYVNNYLRHPAYAEYPVVGVNWEQAVDYCAWRTDRVNERILIEAGILNEDPAQRNENNFNTEAYLAGQYEGAVNKNLPDLNPDNEERRVRWSDGILLPKYRLPTEAEWEYASTGLIGNSKEERITDKKIFPWNGHWVRNEEKKHRGQMMANFSRGRGDYMGTAGALNDGGDITVPVKSFWPNDFGLYCMAGNVNEWVADVYRPMSSEDVAEFNPYRGNVFQTKVRDEEGNIAEKDSLGRIRYRNQKDEEIMNRYNYRTSDNRNYRDGDVQSSMVSDQNWNNSDHQRPGSSRMYVQGKGDNQEGISSMVTDDSRVYKGGSWKDRAFWMAPGTRRYLNQKESRDDIGFRCAMSHVGSPNNKKVK
ncbi:MAG: gliding motility lipoprotein GldJ [Marinifilaceae bacterium]|jgi:gliding motility-associated lipoprotein GldJ